MPAGEMDQLVVEYFIRNMNDRAFQRYSLITDTTSLAGKVLAIEVYLSLLSSNCPVDGTVREEVEANQLRKLVKTLRSSQSGSQGDD